MQTVELSSIQIESVAKMLYIGRYNTKIFGNQWQDSFVVTFEAGQ